jgi:hypothetical protein
VWKHFWGPVRNPEVPPESPPYGGQSKQQQQLVLNSSAPLRLSPDCLPQWLGVCGGGGAGAADGAGPLRTAAVAGAAEGGGGTRGLRGAGRGLAAIFGAPPAVRGMRHGRGRSYPDSNPKTEPGPLDDIPNDDAGGCITSHL